MIGGDAAGVAYALSFGYLQSLTVIHCTPANLVKTPASVQEELAAGAYLHTNLKRSRQAYATRVACPYTIFPGLEIPKYRIVV